MEAISAVSTTDETTEVGADELGPEATLAIELEFKEAEALRVWLLKAGADGTTSLEEPLVSAALTKLGRVIDTIRATTNIRRELEQAGLEVGHLSDEQVRELGRRVSDAAHAGIRD
jgi:hypothetical protein